MQILGGLINHYKILDVILSKIGDHYRVLISKTDVFCLLIGKLATMVNRALNERGQGQKQEDKLGDFNNKSEKTR